MHAKGVRLRAAGQGQNCCLALLYVHTSAAAGKQTNPMQACADDAEEEDRGICLFA